LHEAEQEEHRKVEREIVHQETATLADEIRVLRQEIQGLKSFLKQG
jgi:hypothetical protein